MTPYIRIDTHIAMQFYLNILDKCRLFALSKSITVIKLLSLKCAFKLLNNICVA